MNWGMMSRDRAGRGVQQQRRGQEQPGAERSAHRGVGGLPQGASRSISTSPMGRRERNTWDLFPAKDPNAPCLVFIHGGYWQRNSRDQFASLIAGAYARGWSAALPGYTLAPDATLTEIVAEINAALDWLASQRAGARHHRQGRAVGLVGRRASDGAVPRPPPRERRPRRSRACSSWGRSATPISTTRCSSPTTEIAALSPLRLPMVKKPLAIAYGTAELPPLVDDSRDTARQARRRASARRADPGGRRRPFHHHHELRDADGELTSSFCCWLRAPPSSSRRSCPAGES